MEIVHRLWMHAARNQIIMQSMQSWTPAGSRMLYHSPTAPQRIAMVMSKNQYFIPKRLQAQIELQQLCLCKSGVAGLLVWMGVAR